MSKRFKPKNKKISVTKQVLGNVVNNKKDHQKLISKFHTLNKNIEELKAKRILAQKSRALENALEKIDANILLLEQEKDKLGGLNIYQKASLIGERKFNSAAFLLGTLSTELRALSKTLGQPIQLLDVGALGENYIKEKAWISTTAIDLHPTCNFVKQADFFELPLSGIYGNNPDICVPVGGFDVIVLSLVINFVGDPKKRGEMIHKSFCLLKSQLPVQTKDAEISESSLMKILGGYLYVVVPRPCISNSRYMNEDCYYKIFQQCGFKLIAAKYSPKLAFHIFRRLSSRPPKANMPKTKLRDGPALNNFTIVL